MNRRTFLKNSAIASGLIFVPKGFAQVGIIDAPALRAPASNGDVTTGMVAQYKMNDGSAPSVFVDAVSANNATVGGTVVTAADKNGNAGKAETLSGNGRGKTSSYPLSGYPLTMTCWVKTTASGTIIPMGSGINGQTSLTGDYIVLVNGVPKSQTTVASGSMAVAQGSVAINDGNWHMMAAVFASPTVRTLYIDGVLVATESDSVTSNPSGMNCLCLGYLEDFGISFPFPGTIDDARLYNVALTGTQIAAMNTYGPGL